MLIRLDFEADIPIYEQIRRQIIEGIVAGVLNPGDALPSVRQFGSDLGINLHTVNKAYTSLKQDGYIIVHRQKGVVVADSPPTASDEFKSKLKSEMKPHLAEALLRRMDEETLHSLIKEVLNELKGK